MTTRRNSEHRREYQREYHRRYRKDHPERVALYNYRAAVNRLRKQGVDVDAMTDGDQGGERCE